MKRRIRKLTLEQSSGIGGNTTSSSGIGSNAYGSNTDSYGVRLKAIETRNDEIIKLTFNQSSGLGNSSSTGTGIGSNSNTYGSATTDGPG
jgi:hypothetical protein